jgi:hypothetical protein
MFKIFMYSWGLGKFKQQEGHIIRRDSPEGCTNVQTNRREYVISSVVKSHINFYAVFLKLFRWPWAKIFPSKTTCWQALLYRMVCLVTTMHCSCDLKPVYLNPRPQNMGQTVAQLVRDDSTGRKVAGSHPIGLIGIFYWHNPSGHSMTLGSTQPLTEMSKGGRCEGLTGLSHLCAECL